MADSGKLSSYFHFREPFLLTQKTLLQKVPLLVLTNEPLVYPKWLFKCRRHQRRRGINCLYCDSHLKAKGDLRRSATQYVIVYVNLAYLFSLENLPSSLYR